MSAEDRSPRLNPWAVVHLEVTLVRRKHRAGAVRKADQDRKPEHVMFWKAKEQCPRGERDQLCQLR